LAAQQGATGMSAGSMMAADYSEGEADVAASPLAEDSAAASPAVSVLVRPSRFGF
jgi:hypothetical protein